MSNTNGGWSNVTAIGLITFIQFIYLVIYFQCFCLPRRLWVEGYRTEMDLFTLALIILLGVLMFVSTRLGIITIHQHHHHHHHHHHYSPAPPNMTWGVNWALVEYSSDDRNMYDIEIHGWSRFEFFELCPLSENVKTLEDMFCPQSFCLVKSHCGKDLWPKLV